MRAAVLVAPGRVELRDPPEPAIGPDEALVAPRAVGLPATKAADVAHRRDGVIEAVVELYRR